MATFHKSSMKTCDPHRVWGAFHEVPWRVQQQQQPSGHSMHDGRCLLRARASSQSQQTDAAGHVSNVVKTPSGDIKLGAFLSRKPDVLDAVQEAVRSIRDGMGDDSFKPELALVFATAAYGDALEELVPALRQLVPSLRHVFGCTSFGAIGSTLQAPADVEGVPGISLTLASLSGVEISVTHTLRSAIPDEDASPEAWSDLVALTPGSQLPTSFLVLADPKFQQTRPLLAGLDFAFPGATKVGGVISSGQRYKRRALYAWSADMPVQAGSMRRQGLLSKRRKQQQPAPASSAASSSPEPSSSAQQPQRKQQQQITDRPKEQGFFWGSLFGKIKSTFTDEAAASSSMIGRGYGGSRDGGVSNFLGRDGSGDVEDWATDTGMHMYGAAVLALRGNVYFDPITSQGYRALGDRSWVVGRVSREGNVIYSLIDPTAPEDPEDDAEVPPLLALCDLLESGGMGGQGGDLSDKEMEELSDDKVWVAIAPDALSADKDIAPDDFQMMKLTDFDETYGAICVDGQVRTGYRLKLVLRDPEGIREDLANKLLRLKREDLAAMLAGQARPPAVGTLAFVDLERGASLHDEAGYEAGQVGAFLPVPLAGMFAAAEVSTVNCKAALYELATVAAVLRVSAQPNESSKRGDGAGDAGLPDKPSQKGPA